jgi:plastocyanin
VSGLLTLIAAGEPSKVPFYVSGALLAVWAVGLSVTGLRSPDFPGSQAVSRATMAITAVLVLATMATAVTTASKPEHAEEAAERPASRPAGGAKLEVAADPGGQLAYQQKSLTGRAGRIEIEFVNRAPVMHDVRIEGPGGRQLGGTRQITNSQTTAAVTLRPGRYTFYCSVPGHRQGGMEGPLTVS